MAHSTPPALTSARWNSRTKRIVTLIIVVVGGFALITFGGILPLLIVAALLSYLLWPLVNFIDQRVMFLLPFKTRSLSVLATFVTVIALFVVALIGIIPVLLDQLEDVGRNIPTFIEDIETGLQDVLSRPVSINGNPILVDGEPLIPLDRIEALTGEDGLSSSLDSENFDLMAAVGTFLGSLGSLTGPAFSVLGGAITAVINITFMIVIMFYLMRDGNTFIDHIINVTPRSYRGDARRLFYELGRVWNAYLRGQLILCIAVGTAVYIAALILGLPSAPVLGLIAGFLEFIPNLGPFLALIPATIIALVSQSSTLPFLSGLSFALVVIAVWTGIQQLEAIYLVPRVMGGSLNLHPVVVIIAVIAGASTAGALGVILAAPFTATARVFGQYFYGKLLDTDPFPTPKPYEAGDNVPPMVRLYMMMKRLVIRRTAGSDEVIAEQTISTVQLDMMTKTPLSDEEKTPNVR